MLRHVACAAQLRRAAAAQRRLSARAAAPQCEVEVVEAGGATVATARVALPAGGALDAAAQQAWGRCVAALGGRNPSFALHFGPDVAAAARALSAAAALFAAPGGGGAGGSATSLPALLGASAPGWEPAARAGASAAERAAAARAAEAQLVLAAVALPRGVRAAAFHGDSTSVPELPDLAGALTCRPPHLLLLAHRRFDLGSLASRLDDLLPSSGKAGALATPLPAASGADAPLVALGDVAQARPGFVGLSIAAEAEAEAGGGGSAGVAAAADVAPPLSVPAFAALCRSVFGSARASGWSFSAGVSESIFLPPGAPLAAEEPRADALRAALGRHAAPTQAELELFELDDVILLPGAREELIIYEPRYRLMLRSALLTQHALSQHHANGADDAPPPLACFGVISRGVGVVAAIGSYRIGADGRAHVAVHGGRRFRLPPGARCELEMGTFGLSRGEVTFFDDDPPKDADAAAALSAAAEAAAAAVAAAMADARATAPLAHADAALASVLRHAAAPDGDADAEALSWALAGLLPAASVRLRAWRDYTCTLTRLQEQLRYLQSHRDATIRHWVHTLA